jgi:hypothetical protein
MDHPDAHEGDAVRATRFYVDLMVTLSEDDIHGAEAIDLLRPLWGNRPAAATGGTPPETEVDAKLTAWATIAEAMAEMVAAERRNSGRADSSLADVWRDLQLAMTQNDEADEGADGGDAGT